MNDPVICMSQGTKVQPRIKGTNLVTRHGFPEGSYVIPNQAEYMDDDTWANVVKVLTPGIRKMKVSNVAYVFPILFSIYLTIHMCPSKFSEKNV